MNCADSEPTFAVQVVQFGLTSLARVRCTLLAVERELRPVGFLLLLNIEEARMSEEGEERKKKKNKSR